ncbi:hypothetical protein PPYR_07374 [Photinus pyralis]|uniref:Uncharacterized protein n=1 Tax=Photinus pyralis TaxID=7054 RepID=A0A1Y1LH04_PHOPY|nr:26S proteasome non-ATPase regulatory subunit 10-like [Photinus pyralis]KAB0799494.1 hypothetical protein PPYR_07374 [Photinus pyralis]
MSNQNNIYEAAHKGDYNTVVEKVTEDNKLVTQPDGSKRILIHWAVLSGNVELVKFLIELHSPIDPFDDTDTTPLILSASAGKLNVVDVLLQNNANINHKNELGHSALQYACSKGWLEVAKLLLENKADVNIADLRGATPLHRAASKGNLEIVKLLVECSSLQIDSRDYYGNSALHLACEEDRVDEAKLLVQKGADINLTNKERQTPLQLCTKQLAAALLELVNNQSNI